VTSGKTRVVAARPGARRKKERSTHPRDQAKTPFTAILEGLIARLPGAFGVALVDSEGESVDYAGDVDAFDVRVSAAHWRLVLDHIPGGLGSARSLVVCGARRSFILYSLPDGYALVVLLRRRAAFPGSSRAFFATERELASEAGWTPSKQARHWYPIDVECDRARRPIRLRSGQAAASRREEGGGGRLLEVLGTIAGGLGDRESGFRVRTDTGAELTLVREPGGRWYADEPLLHGAREPSVIAPKND
jgi:hypothetical protein